MTITSGKEMLTWRLFMGLKQADVAQMYGISTSDVVQMENGGKTLHEGIVRNAGKGNPGK